MKPPEKYFLYVGNAYPHKNLERLLLASTKITSRIKMFKKFSLVLVGEQDFFYKRLKEKVKEMGFEDVVVFWGPADRKELEILYKNAIALVFPSLMEGFGLPAVEAMNQGCLVLASDIPVFHEVLGEAVVYFNPYNVEDIASKLESILKEPQKYESFKVKGLDQVRRYSWEKLARQTLAVYEKFIKRG